jgi:hypothetical protein
MVTSDSKGNLVITLENCDFTEYSNILRGLVATIQTAVTHPHFNGEIQNDIDFAFELLLKMLPSERQAAKFLSKKTTTAAPVTFEDA